MAVEHIDYMAGDVACKGVLVWNEKITAKRPLLLMSPNWLGVSEDAISRAAMMAGDKYIAFVADIYGGGKAVAGPPEAADLANGVRADATLRRLRIKAALDALVEAAAKRGIGDASKKAAVGFCFGGGNVLELARSGADIQAAISVHGDLTSHKNAGKGEVKAHLLVLHGAADPVAPKAERDTFEAEMEGAGASWQMLTFGHRVHSFAEKEADIKGIAEYEERAARQSYAMIDTFIADAFAGLL